MTTYTVSAEWGDGHWLLEVPELPGVSAQVRYLAEAASTIRTAIASKLEVEPQSIGVEVLPVIPAEVAALADEVARERDELAKVQRRVTATTRAAVEALTRAGWQKEDIYRILGIKVRRAVGTDEGATLGAA